MLSLLDSSVKKLIFLDPKCISANGQQLRSRSTYKIIETLLTLAKTVMFLRI